MDMRALPMPAAAPSAASLSGWRHARYVATENPVTWPDFHATVLHLLGINHEALTFYHNGIERRLTNVHGHVVKNILA